MKEYPILFSADMVRAILDGRKMQTRRVILPQPYKFSSDSDCWNWHHPGHNKKTLLPTNIDKYLTHFISQKYGQTGDTLWVREAWMYLWKLYEEENWMPLKDGGFIAHRASFNTAVKEVPNIIINDNQYGYSEPRWKPSIHMPRAAARLFLTNTGEKIERIKDISEADAIAEGIEYRMDSLLGILYKNYSTKDSWWHSAANSFSTLWNSINAAPKPAKRNPYTFQKEDCYISFPWHDIRATEQYRGKTHYIVGNPWVRAISFEINP